MSNWNAVCDAFGAPEGEVAKAYEYLGHFGYITGNVVSGAVNPDQAKEAIVYALADLQHAAGLHTTGCLDEDTLEVIDRPRCGCLDVARLNWQESRWQKRELTYTVERYLPGLSMSEQDNIYEAAFQSWEDIGDVKITRVISGSRADMVISTGSGARDNMDGPSGTLAWAYMPTGSDQPLLMRFDLAEKWIKAGGSPGVLLLNVAAHEFGHLLGLDHSTSPRALMAPFYSAAVSKPQAVDDIPRFQSLYGPTTLPTPTPSPTPTPTPGRKLVIFEIDGNVRSISCPGFKITPTP